MRNEPSKRCRLSDSACCACFLPLFSSHQGSPGSARGQRQRRRGRCGRSRGRVGPDRDMALVHGSGGKGGGGTGQRTTRSGAPPTAAAASPSGGLTKTCLRCYAGPGDQGRSDTSLGTFYATLHQHFCVVLCKTCIVATRKAAGSTSFQSARRNPHVHDTVRISA